MKLLVTGGAGFIGSNFVHYILEKYPDYQVITVDDLTYAGNLENLKKWETDSRHTFVKGDILDQALMDKLVSNCDAIIHFAAESHVDRSISSPGAFVQTNIQGTYTLLESARKYNRRFHHISTDEVYGSLEIDERPFHESTPYSPRSPYSASKAGSDHLVQAYFHTYGLPITVSNCSNNYGPFHFPEKLIPLAITNILEGKKVPVYGDGLQRRDWLHVRDHCRAIDLILHKGRIGNTYCVGGNGERENMWIVKKILEILDKGEDQIEYVQDRAGHDRRYAIDSTKITQELGWQPEIDLEEGLKETVTWFQDNKEWWKRVKDGSYKDYQKF